jgi:hypothetical protein
MRISQTSLFSVPEECDQFILFPTFFSSRVLTAFPLAGWGGKIERLTLSRCVLSAKIINSALVFVINPEGKYFIREHRDLPEEAKLCGRNFRR